MSITLPVRAFLEIEVNGDEWQLSKEYDEAMTPHIDSVPTSFYLPWPPELIVQPGQEIYLYGLPIGSDGVVITHLDYQYTKTEGYAGYMRTKTKIERRGVFDLSCLLCLAEEGFLIENQRKTIKEVLEAAGLASTEEEYEKRK